MFQYLEIGTTEERGRGFFAKKDIPPATTILKVHNSLFLTIELLNQHQLFYQVLGSSKSKITQFAFYLAYTWKKHQKQPNGSALEQYIENLPLVFHNLICWSQTELGRLTNRKLVDDIRRKKESIRQAFDFILMSLVQNQQKLLQRSKTKITNEYGTPRRGSRRILASRSTKEAETIIGELNILKTITFEDILRFVSAIQSRNIYHSSENDKQSDVGALIPTLEMFNHSIFSKCQVEYIKEYFQVTSKTHIKKGEEIFVNYGNHTNEKYLEFYGMIPKEGTEKTAIQQMKSSGQSWAMANPIPPSPEQIRAELTQRYNQSIKQVQEEKE